MKGGRKEGEGSEEEDEDAGVVQSDSVLIVC
jgi:hypothetical protein